MQPATAKAATKQRARRGSKGASRRSASRSKPDAVFRDRQKRLRAKLKELDADALLITNANDIRYLTGFRGEDSVAVLAPRRLLIISDFRFEEELSAVRSRASVRIRTGGMIDAIRDVVHDLAPDRLVLQAEHCSLAFRRALARAVGARRLKEATGLITSLRAVKDDAEIRAIRKAVRVQEAAFETVLETLESGRSETLICADLERELKTRGAEEPAFGTIVAAGPNGSLPHAVPGARRSAKGRPLLIDWGARVDGYCGDMTRTLSLARWPAELRSIYEIVLDAHLAAIEAVRPGAAARDVDDAARRIIERAGYGERFGHGLGHGIGLNVHEAPRLAKTSGDVLEAGMVVTIEPGVYIPGLGGVRIEDDILVTEGGSKNLCSLPKTLDWATR